MYLKLYKPKIFTQIKISKELEILQIKVFYNTSIILFLHTYRLLSLTCRIISFYHHHHHHHSRRYYYFQHYYYCYIFLSYGSYKIKEVQWHEFIIFIVTKFMKPTYKWKNKKSEIGLNKLSSLSSFRKVIMIVCLVVRLPGSNHNNLSLSYCFISIIPEFHSFLKNYCSLTEIAC